MVDRATLIDDFLSNTVWKDWQRTAIAGDASGRRYMRLGLNDQSLILMDAPPENGEDTRPFLRVAQALKSHGLCPPDVLAHDAEHGLMVLSDLGRIDFAQWLTTHPAAEKALYQAAADIIIALRRMDVQDAYAQMTPATGAEMIGIVGTHYCKSDITGLVAEMEASLAQFAPNPDCFSLRDFHAENLIWRPSYNGTDRVGLLDFQDAFVAPAGYDLASLLRDARRDVPESLVQDMISYVAENTHEGNGFGIQVACLGVQRNLRILGVFARLAKVHGKARYLEFMPRVWAHITEDLKTPELANLRAAVLDTIPAPTSEMCKGIFT